MTSSKQLRSKINRYLIGDTYIMNTSVNEHTYHLRGLSTDTKPILKNLSNGSSFLEIDTGKFYIFDGSSLS